MSGVHSGEAAGRRGRGVSAADNRRPRSLRSRPEAQLLDSRIVGGVSGVWSAQRRSRWLARTGSVYDGQMEAPRDHWPGPCRGSGVHQLTGAQRRSRWLARAGGQRRGHTETPLTTFAARSRASGLQNRRGSVERLECAAAEPLTGCARRLGIDGRSALGLTRLPAREP